MAAVYIHIPFCSKACHYCNFHFSTSLHRKAGMVDAMEKELLQFPQGTLPAYQRQAGTLYFGGGTPSLLSKEELQRLIRAAATTFDINANAEITLEANPDDIDEARLAAWAELGINRLSIGVQSFFDEHLRWMNRAHLGQQAIEAIRLAQRSGIGNISIDLIYGVPGLSMAQWQENLAIAASLGITHLSGYALTVESHTALDHFIKKGKVAAPDESLQAAQFNYLQQWVEEQQWEAYEISNYARPGFRSRHNSSYWTGMPYYGFGPSAHSFDGQLTRWWNVANNALYQTAIEQDLPFREMEHLTQDQRINELIMTLLRTMEGLPVDDANHSVAGMLMDHTQWKTWRKRLGLQIEKGNLVLEKGHAVVQSSARFLADGIASDLFL